MGQEIKKILLKSFREIVKARPSKDFWPRISLFQIYLGDLAKNVKNDGVNSQKCIHSRQWA